MSLNQQNFPFCSDLLYLSGRLHVIFMIHMTQNTFSFIKTLTRDHLLTLLLWSLTSMHAPKCPQKRSAKIIFMCISMRISKQEMLLPVLESLISCTLAWSCLLAYITVWWWLCLFSVKTAVFIHRGRKTLLSVVVHAFQLRGEYVTLLQQKAPHTSKVLLKVASNASLRSRQLLPLPPPPLSWGRRMLSAGYERLIVFILQTQRAWQRLDLMLCVPISLLRPTWACYTHLGSCANGLLSLTVK